MGVCPDFKELLESFNAESVEYLVVGGYALAHNGITRNTRNLDLYVRGRSQGECAGTAVPFLGRKFIANKKAAGRLRDLANVEQLCITSLFYP